MREDPPWEFRGDLYGAYRLNRSARDVRIQIAIVPKLVGPDAVEDKFPPEWERDPL